MSSKPESAPDGPLPKGDPAGGTIIGCTPGGDPLFQRLDIVARLLERLATWPSEPSLVHAADDGEQVVAVAIGEELSGGRASDNQIVFSPDNATGSRLHFRVRRKGDGFVVDDLDSRNGTYVNGKPCKERPALVNGDCIEAGGKLLVFIEGIAPRAES